MAQPKCFWLAGVSDATSVKSDAFYITLAGDLLGHPTLSARRPNHVAVLDDDLPHGLDVGQVYIYGHCDGRRLGYDLATEWGPNSYDPEQLANAFAARFAGRHAEVRKIKIFGCLSAVRRGGASFAERFARALQRTPFAGAEIYGYVGWVLYSPPDSSRKGVYLRERPGRAPGTQVYSKIVPAQGQRVQYAVGADGAVSKYHPGDLKPPVFAEDDEPTGCIRIPCVVQ
ncbi:MAG TPA: hypothetical protein VFQ38_16405 [Longimicrobiales bacterium]|nr:hypothetical protein [Longimicrobiales bacterium]